jgi:hypothetical protein
MNNKEIPARVVTLTGSKEKVLELLQKVINKKIGVSIPDLTPGVRQNVSEIYKTLQKHYGAPGKFIATWIPFGDGQLLEACQGKLVDKTAVELFDIYSVRWIEALKAEGLIPKEIHADFITSSRVLIAELFQRLLYQALREDSKLPTTKDRFIWLECMAELTKELLNTEHNNISLDEDFRPILTSMLKTWIPAAKEMVTRIEDLGKAKTVISQNIDSLNSMNLHVMRCLAVQLVDKTLANQSWKGRLKIDHEVIVSLKEVEEKWMKDRKKLITPDNSSVLVITADSQVANNQLSLTYRELNIIKLQLVDQETINRQQTIFENHPDRLVRDLYSLLNWVKVVLALVQQFADLVSLAGWIPLLMEGLALQKLDREITSLKAVFDRLTDSDHMKCIKNTKLYYEMQEPIADIISIRLQKLHAFNELQDKELLQKVRTTLVQQLKSMQLLGQQINCEIISPKLSDNVIESLTPSESKSVSSNQILQNKSHLLIENTPLSAPEIGSNRDMVQVHTSDPATAISTPYIGIFLNQLQISPTMAALYHRFLHKKILSFLNHFDDDNFFLNASIFVKSTRTLIQTFEKKKMQAAEPEWGANVWKQRREEVFCLKYFCVISLHENNDLQLLEFIRRIVESSDKAVFNIPALKYNELLIKLEALLQQAKTDNQFSYTTPSPVGDFYEASSALAQQNSEQALTIVSRDEEIGKYKAINNSQKKEIEKKDSMIQEKEAVIQEKEAVIQEKDSMIQEKDSMIQEKESVIQNKNKALQLKAADMATLESENSNLRHKVNDMIEQYKAQNENLKKLQQDFQLQNQSVGQQLTTIMERFDQLKAENDLLKQSQSRTPAQLMSESGLFSLGSAVQSSAKNKPEDQPSLTQL